MRKLVLVFFLSALFIILSDVCADALSAESYCLIDAETLEILYAENADTKMGMASTTKIMTAILALESGRADEIATVSDKAVLAEGSSLYLKPGEQMRVYDLVCGLLLNSGNDAAIVIAEHIGGSVDAFVDLMNRKANALGAYDTHFINASGLSDDAHYTTARDLAVLSAYAMKNAVFQRIVSTKNMQIATTNSSRLIYLNNHNKLLNNTVGCDGVKTGFTKASGRCLVSSIHRDGMRTICVTLNAPNDWDDHKILHKKAFMEFENVSVFEEGVSCGTLRIENSHSRDIGMVVSKTQKCTVKKGEGKQIVYEINFRQPTPMAVSEGEVVGKMSAKLNGDIIAQVDLIAERSSCVLQKKNYIKICVALICENYT